MNNIHTYEDLQQECARLEALLIQHKQSIRTDVGDIREALRPALEIARVVDQMVTHESGQPPIVVAGAHLTIDLILYKLLKKSNFLFKMILPPLLKNITSHYIPQLVLAVSSLARRRT